jgi:hypothetical protein
MEKVERNDKCPCGSGKKYKNCCMYNHSPRRGILRLAYEIGTQDDFMARMFMQMINIREHVYKKEEYNAFDKKHHALFQNLYEAKIAKEKCLSLMKTHKEKVKNGEKAEYSETEGVIKIHEAIDTELNMAFKDFFIRGNIALKALVKVCGHIGYNMSFAFTDDDKFESKKNKFLRDNPDPEFIDYCKVIEDDRKNWYKIFIYIRNSIEHEGFKLPDVNYLLGKNNEVKTFFPTINHQTLEEVLNICWTNLFQICEEMIVLLLSKKLKDPFVIAEVPEIKRNPQNPIKYVISIKGFPPMQSQVEPLR